jgi:hypothetical protein
MLLMSAIMKHFCYNFLKHSCLERSTIGLYTSDCVCMRLKLSSSMIKRSGSEMCEAKPQVHLTPQRVRVYGECNKNKIISNSTSYESLDDALKFIG